MFKMEFIKLILSVFSLPMLVILVIIYDTEIIQDDLLYALVALITPIVVVNFAFALDILFKLFIKKEN